MQAFKTKRKRYDERGNDKWETYSTPCYEDKEHGRCEMKNCLCPCHWKTQTQDGKP